MSVSSLLLRALRTVPVAPPSEAQAQGLAGVPGLVEGALHPAVHVVKVPVVYARDRVCVLVEARLGQLGGGVEGGGRWPVGVPDADVTVGMVVSPIRRELTRRCSPAPRVRRSRRGRR